MLTFQAATDAIDGLIRSGHGEQARRQLRMLIQSKLEREQVVVVAALARRTNLHHYALKILHPFVRPTGKSSEIASDAERAEYAASLTYVGASEEALSILLKLDASHSPQVLLFEAFARFAQWDYAPTVNVLERYVVSPGLADYQRMVGNVNLASALVYERQSTRAEKVLQELRRQTGGGRFPLLYGNVLELSAQNYLWAEDFTSAERSLREANNLLKSSTGLNEFFVRKWMVILEILRTKGNPKSLEPLRRIRAEAMGFHWESVRDFDRIEAMTTKSVPLFTHLYFGTPFAGLRARFLSDFQQSVRLPEFYEWKVSGPSRRARTLDVFLGRDLKSGNELKHDQLQHRMLKTLSQDFYRPIRLAVAHHNLYANQFFNPISSPHQVHEAVRRLRLWFKKQNLPLFIDEKQGFYRLRATAPCALRVPNPGDALSGAIDVHVLQKTWGDTAFSTEQFAKSRRLSLRTASRILKKHVANGVISKLGAGPTTHYKLAQTALKSTA